LHKQTVPLGLKRSNNRMHALQPIERNVSDIKLLSEENQAVLSTTLAPPGTEPVAIAEPLSLEAQVIALLERDFAERDWHDPHESIQ